ncbi:uncharacterized protein TRIREDRAFT_107866 [Trichoderma reesei QM6a]|uniref:Predicted protein n=1 Tax=Hypocrea jecorina (strain QM6a) TaxID=431241 RepID=G0RKK4_HYPJQ|nr:uncharacterized protein TRIREDRAFT_107866 [Trichoderma reesei QM6a]EGR48441.1 predicted protein [Trichoderma reesei QM6a]
MFPMAMDMTTDSPEVDSPSSMDKAASWTRLPVELRQKILNFVGSPFSGRQYDGLASPKLAPFATVCREWQVFFETCTFRRLVLDPDSLARFDTIIRRRDSRLGYIRKLWLRIKLSTYNCPDCNYPEDVVTQNLNNGIFTDCILSLLGTLKLWVPARHGAQGLVLMLSVSSPSDTAHWFSRCEMKDNYPFHYAEDLGLSPGMVEFHQANTAHPFIQGVHRGDSMPWHNGHFKRLHGTPLRLVRRGKRGRFISQHRSLPAVPMVKGLVMRRQFRREIHVGSLSCLLARSFVALEWFCFERTLCLKPRHQLTFDQGTYVMCSHTLQRLSDETDALSSGFQSRLLPSLPKTLRQFSFTQWDIPRKERNPTHGNGGPGLSLHAQANLLRKMAKVSQRLEQLCPPWQMDAGAFLQSIIELGESPETVESSLKRIILRCSLSSSQTSSMEFGSLVLLAAKTALSLPQLEVFELWGTYLDEHDSSAYIFRYMHEDRRASMVWRSFENTMTCQARIIPMWSEVAQKHSHSSLTYNAVPFTETKADLYKSEGSCIYRHLLLKDLAFDPITQIILENEPYDWCSDDEKSQVLNQGNPLTPHYAHTLSLAGIGQDDDPALLQADIMTFETEVNAFLQHHYG